MTGNLSSVDLKKHMNFLKVLTRAGIELEMAVKYNDLYGAYGLFMSKYITPYFWIVPLGALSFLLLIFKRTHLFGPSQKYLVIVMSIDVFFTMLTGFKDIVFNVMGWNYGIVEYQTCWILLSFFRFQFVLHATSLWIKSLMFVHRVLMFLFPFKMRQWNLKKICVPFVFLHAILSMVYGAATILSPFKRVHMLQKYNPEMPFKTIDACVFNLEDEYFTEFFHRVIHWTIYIIHIVYFLALPIVINILCTTFLIYLVRKEINKISFLTPNGSTKNVKYLILIKVHILLGISFIFQEIPTYVSFILGSMSRNTIVIHTAQVVILVNMFQSFALGKPIDVIIYASLSKRVKSELQKCVCYRKTSRKN